MTIVLAAILARLIRFERRREAGHASISCGRWQTRPRMTAMLIVPTSISRRKVGAGSIVPRSIFQPSKRPTFDCATPSMSHRRMSQPICRALRAGLGLAPARGGCCGHRRAHRRWCFWTAQTISAVWRTTVGRPDGNHWRIAAADASSPRASLAETDTGGRCADDHRTRTRSARRCGAVEIIATAMLFDSGRYFLGERTRATRFHGAATGRRRRGLSSPYRSRHQSRATASAFATRMAT